MDIKYGQEVLQTFAQSIAVGVEVSCNLNEIKSGVDHVSSSDNAYVKPISAELDLTTPADTDFLLWIEIPIDVKGFVIQKDREKLVNKFNDTPMNYSNTVQGEIAMDEFMRDQFHFDDVEDAVSQRIGSKTWACLASNSENGDIYSMEELEFAKPNFISWVDVKAMTKSEVIFRRIYWLDTCDPNK